ncbi:MAG: energy transducer TonB [Chthoniobacterales bacterium]
MSSPHYSLPITRYSLLFTALAFFLAVIFHGALFLLGRSFYKPPEYAVREGNSNLEVGLVDAASMGKNSSATIDEKVTTAKVKQAATLVSEKKLELSSRTHPGEAKKISSVASEKKIAGLLKSAPSYLRNPQPTYPEAERISGHEGVVLLRVVVTKEGKILKATIEHSSGYDALDKRALETVLDSWSFRPALLNQEPVKTEIFIPIHFSLNSKNSNSNKKAGLLNQ